MGIQERRERDREEMKRRIIDAAVKLFIQEGYATVTIRRIAEYIEYSPAVVYLYFKDKEEILYAIHKVGARKCQLACEAPKSINDPLVSLRELLITYIDFGLANPEFYQLIFISTAMGKIIWEKNEWKEWHDNSLMLVRTVQECLDKGLLKPASADAISFMLWSLLHGVMSLIIRNRCPDIPVADRRATVIQTLDYVLKGITVA